MRPASEKPLTYEMLAEVIKTSAGVPLDPAGLEAPEARFKDLGVDSLGLLGIVAELERRCGVTLGQDAEQAPSPHELVGIVRAEQGGAASGKGR
ncbi:acyl carrier protein [Streptomyces sp. NPDC048172]|uniref:acyl carrier protein n=1 Tax=Streptomyces sp. NPDC048172 TaxID=3365505 RepID=UPI00371DD869